MEGSYSLKSNPLKLTLVIILAGAIAWLVLDLLFDKPEIHDGIIVDMHYLPGESRTGQYRLGSRSRPQIITGQSHDRWIVAVRKNNGDTVLVECKKHHFDGKEIGHSLRFREFSGGSLEIKYFAHSDDQ
ncbi:MAG TPA: hypothetical protein P5280_02035 [Cyclobacteriaceae bacterium]|nr:hypothetical protein [Cyclobacteriaceae bacterium]